MTPARGSVSRVAQPKAQARPAIDAAQFTRGSAPSAPVELAQPDEIPGEDPDLDEEASVAPAPAAEAVEMGPSGRFPAWFENDFIQYYEARSTNPAKAREIVIGILRTKIQPDANGLPTKRVGVICWQAMINAKIAQGVHGDGFVDHHMGQASDLSDDAASESAAAMGMSKQATAVGL